MTASQLIAALQAAMTSNGGNDAPLVFQVTDAKSAGQKMSSISSVIFVGATVHEGPRAPAVEVPAVVNILLP